MRIYLGGKAIKIDARNALGKGGEADVYTLPDGRALKIFKTPTHPDFRHDVLEQQAAAKRLDQHQTKLPAFPTGLPERVVVPDELATNRRRTRVLGYSMRRIDNAELLYRFSEPRFRRQGIRGTQAVDVLRDLHATVKGVHAAGVVIGDFNDLNVLVVADRAYLIDADSFQFGNFICPVFTERFVDPLLCDPNAAGLVLAQPHTPTSDWYAFTVIVMRSLICVGPYGGVHRPKNPKQRIAQGSRPLHRLTVFDSDVVYPKPAIHFDHLPDDLLQVFHRVFEADERIEFPVRVLDELRWTRCSKCGAEHARRTCPRCAALGSRSVRKPIRVTGRVTAETIFETSGSILCSALIGDDLRYRYWEDNRLLEQGARLISRGPLSSAMASRALLTPATQRHCYWIDGDVLYRDDSSPLSTAPLRIGDVIGSQTRFWVGESFGFGFYAAGNMTVGFTFDPERPGIDDSVPLPPLRGTLVSAHCVISEQLAWLFMTEEVAGTLYVRLTVVDQAGRVVASDESPVSELTWMTAAGSACAIGQFLFVATDEGIVRVVIDGDGTRVASKFPDTEPYVDSAVVLHPAPNGIYVVGRNNIINLRM